MLLWILFVIIWIAIAFWPARVAARKGHSFFGYFILSLIFFPLALIMTSSGLRSDGDGLADARPRLRAWLQLSCWSRRSSSRWRRRSSRRGR